MAQARNPCDPLLLMLPFYLGSTDKKSGPSISPPKSYQISPPHTVNCVDQVITISPEQCVYPANIFDMAIIINYNKSAESFPTYDLSFFTALRIYPTAHILLALWVTTLCLLQISQQVMLMNTGLRS